MLGEDLADLSELMNGLQRLIMIIFLKCESWIILVFLCGVYTAGWIESRACT